MVYEYTKEVAESLVDEELISCFLCTGQFRVSFSPFKKYLRKTEFYNELREPKPEAPYIYKTRKVLVFIYKQKALSRISFKDIVELLKLLTERCKKLKVKRLLLPINTFLIEGISMDSILLALEMADTEGVDIYYF